jgi:hypothetical protein
MRCEIKIGRQIMPIKIAIDQILRDLPAFTLIGPEIIVE